MRKNKSFGGDKMSTKIQGDLEDLFDNWKE